MKLAAAVVLGLVFSGMSVFAAESSPVTGVYEADTAGLVQWKPKVLTGQVTVAKVFAKNGPIKAGDAVAELTVENQDETVSAIQRALMQAQRALDEAKEDAEAQAKSGALELEKARVEADRTSEVKRFWRDLGRADRLVEARQATETKEAVIKDKEEELRQLEAMYKQARIDGNTQELVINRERRSLRMERDNLEILKHRTDQAVRWDIPYQDESIVRDETAAKQQLDAAKRKVARDKAKCDDAVKNAEIALKQAQKKKKDLDADLTVLTLAAPAAGVLDGFSLKVGDTFVAPKDIAKVFATAKGTVKLQVPLAQLNAFTVEKVVSLRVRELGNAVIEGRVTETAWVGQPGKEAGATFPVTVSCGDERLRPGVTVEVVTGGKL